MAKITQQISTVTVLPPPPNPNNPATFDALAYAYTVAQNAFGLDMNNVAGQLNTFATQANAVKDEVNSLKEQTLNIKNAAIAETTNIKNAAIAETTNIKNAAITETATIKTSIEQIALTVAAVANFKGVWSDLSGALNVPASVYHEGSYYMLLQNIDDISAHNPSTSTVWADLHKLYDYIFDYVNLSIIANTKAITKLTNKLIEKGVITID